MSKFIGSIGSVVWDKGERQSVNGLHMRTAKNGTRSWFVYYRTKAGVQRRPKLGDCDLLTLGQARDAARAILAKVQLGLDPREAAEKEKEEAKAKRLAAVARSIAVPTVADLYEAAVAGKWGAERYKNRLKSVRHYWKTMLSEEFGSLSYDALTPARLGKWHMALEATPYLANRAKEILSVVYNHAEKYRLIPKGTNPCADVDSHPEMSRERFATPEEIKAIWAEFEKEEVYNPIRVAFLKLLLFTGSRPLALEKARRDQLEVFEKDGKKYGILTADGKSTQKTGKAEKIVFAPEAMAILDSLPEDPDGLLIGCKYPTPLWNRIRKRVGCDDLRARDLRRTFGTMGYSGGVNLNVIGELLNHTNTNTTRIYAKLMNGPRLEAAGQIAGNITSLLRKA